LVQSKDETNKKFCGARIFDLRRFFFIRMMIDTSFEDNLSYIMNTILSFSKPGDLLLVEQTMMMMDIGLSVYSSFVSNVCYQVDSFFFFSFSPSSSFLLVVSL